VSNSKEVKISIRKRLFFSALARGESGERYGFKLCLCCRGKGAVCVEYQDGKSHYAAFQDCPVCNGEKIIPLSNDN
jgi:hypothetical protein